MLTSDELQYKFAELESIKLLYIEQSTQLGENSAGKHFTRGNTGALLAFPSFLS